jgi:hypothetical protein
MEDTIFAHLLRNIAEQKQGLMEHLAAGGAKNFEDYCRSAGYFAALQRVYDDIKDLEKRFIAD